MINPKKDTHPKTVPPYTQEWAPISDPTALTTAQLLRELSSLKEVVFTRLDGMDRAIVIFNDNITRVPTDTDKQISHLKELHEKWFEEKFRSIQVQFTERDTRTEQTSKDSKVAVDAALQAAKEAVEKQNTASALAIAKAETGTAKQIDQLTELFQTAIGAMDSKFADLKERLLLIEGRTVGITTAQTTQQGAQHLQQAASGHAVSLIGMVAGLLFGAVGIIFALLK